MDTESLRFIMFIIPFVGGFALYVGIEDFKEYIRLKKEVVEVDAEVVDIETTSDEGVELYAPVFSYSYLNKTYTNISTSSSSKKPVIHSHVRLKLDPANPQDSYVDSRFRTFAYYFTPFAGLLMLINGLVISYHLLQEIF